MKQTPSSSFVLSQSVAILLAITIWCHSCWADASTATATTNAITPSSGPSKPKVVVIVGAGPAGLLFAHYLLQSSNDHNNHYEIHVLERQSDPLQLKPSELRTYPVSLQQKRGLRALHAASPTLSRAVEDAGGWMTATHFRAGDETSTSKSFRFPMLAVDRNQLALVLLQHLTHEKREKDSSNNGNRNGSLSTIEFHFDAKLIGVNLEENTLSVQQRPTPMRFDYLIAADGSRSAVRQSLVDQGYLSATITKLNDECFAFSTLSKSDATDGEEHNQTEHKNNSSVFRVDANSYNGWSLEGGINVLALPLNGVNNGEITSGMISYPQGQYLFQNMAPKEVVDFFQQHAPRTLGKLITLQEVEELLHRPVNKLYSVKCDQLNVQDKVLLLGDAAHATSNLLGQGVNSAFEDVRLFFELIKKKTKKRNHSEDTAMRQAIASWTETRLPDVRAVQEMSEWTTPPTPGLMKEFRQRQALRNRLRAPWLGRLVAGADAMQLLADTDWAYSKVYRRTRWWSDKVKKNTPG